MRNSIFIFCLLTLNLCFAQKGTVVLNDSLTMSQVSLMYQLSNPATFELSTSETDDLIKLIRKFIKQKNSEVKQNADQFPGGRKNAKRYKIKRLGNYRLQIVTFLNEQGQQEVWINGFCSYHNNWKNQLIEVFDGGNCYFSMRINLTNGTLISARTNAYA